MAGQSSLTKSVIYPCTCRPSSCVCCKSVNTRRWAPAVRSRATSGTRGGAPRPAAKCHASILAAGHRPLEDLIKAGQLREDLYYRLKVVTILIPPLRERRTDLVLLIEHFLRRFAEKNGKTIRGLTPEAREILLRYDYPGNVRELENIVERAVVLTRDDVIGSGDLPLTVQEPEMVADGDPQTNLTAAVEALERRMI